MSSTYFDRQRTALLRLVSSVRERAAAEAAVDAEYRGVAEEAEKEIAKIRRQLAGQKKQATDAADEAYQQAVTELATKYNTRRTATDRRKAEAIFAAEERYKNQESKQRATYQERLWTIDSLVEAAEREAVDNHTKLIRQTENSSSQLAAAWTRVEPCLARVGIEVEEIEFPADRLPPPIPTDPEGKLLSCVEAVDDAVVAVERCVLPRLVGIGPTLGLILGVGLLGTGLGLLVTQPVTAIVIGCVAAAVGGTGLWFVLNSLARRQVRNKALQFGVFQTEAVRAVTGLRTFADANLARQKSDLKRRHDNDRKRTADHFEPILANLAAERDATLEQATTDHARRQERADAERKQESETTDKSYADTLTDIDTRFGRQLRDAEDRHAGKIAAAVATRAANWKALAETWQTGLAFVDAELTDLQAVGDRVFPAWSALVDPARTLPTDVPAGVRFGSVEVDLYALPDGEPMDARLTPEKPIHLTTAAYLPFPGRCAVVLKGADAGRSAAVGALQAMMLRFLTGLPAGKVRFTIIDPVGLGENFAAFMHLADYDEQLVGARIWTEPGQIEKRLTDLTEHMENVIQKYLRNQYKSIEEYNRSAGEVAEPYRVLVIANFPTNFTPEAARRLVSIASSGPACGVCTLIGVDTKATLPRDFRLADLEQVAFNLTWKDGTFTPADVAFAPFPLTVDSPPDPATVAALVRRVGEASRNAARVEVPFDFIMPPEQEHWTGTTAKSFDIPIGRAGATKRQMFSLGRGTAQHALIAGKTGSGKSTLLHALITNLALLYSPDEAEVYLIDFKKGVEFQAYAAHQLPHARVIAIESEREFGLSVLQRLDAELRDRGDRFRQAGVNDLDGYRQVLRAADPTATLPRILFIVDEFQEFFVEDDKLAQEAGLLLDRLVRQGRAFGLHVLLGSQTLGGSYSLARSTIDQMAVRIALQCSDADAQMILSKDNTAARLLSRPGEAIYNDANGMTEGNDPFQVVWLDESRRDHLLAQVRDRAAGRYPPPLVFAGNVAAELSSNRQVNQWLDSPVVSTVPVVPLGDAVAIKEPTAAVFRAQSGANLLLIGQSEEAAVAIAVTAMTAIRCQAALPTDGSRLITLLDGTPDDAEQPDGLKQAAAALGLTTAFVERFELATAFGALADELARRLAGSADRSPRFVIVNGLHRFRELRKPDDDFGFGRKADGPKSPGDVFVSLIKDGPGVGMHTIVWCDSLTNLNRALDRGVIKEFTQRVLFQMSGSDSSTLIDTPAASRLGKTRALFVTDELERPEKFRPYGSPDLAWLRSRAAALRG